MRTSKIKYGVVTIGNHPKIIALFDTLQQAKFNAKKYKNTQIKPIATWDLTT